MKYGTKTIKLLLACAVVFGVSYFYLSYYRNAFYDLTADEGYIIYGAKRVLDGQILYKDFFQFYPPGDFYLLALVFKLFGYSFIIARETTVIIDSLINTLLFYFSYKAIRSWYAILPPLFFLILGYPNWMQYSHYWSSMLFLFISLAFFLIYLEQNKIIYIFLTGIFIGITGLFLQTPAAYASLLLLLVLILEKRKEQSIGKKVFLFLMGVGIPLIIAFGYIAWKGAFFDFIKEQYFASKIYSEAVMFNPMVLYLRHFGKYSVIFLLFTGIAIFCGVALIFFWKRLSNPEKTIFICNITLFFTSGSRMDFDHILVNSEMVFIIVLLPIKWLSDIIKSKSSFLYKGFFYVWSLIAIALVAWGVVSIKANINIIETRAYKINLNGTHAWTFNTKQAYDVNEFIPQAKNLLHGEKNVFVYPYCSLIYVFLHLNNPTFMDMMSNIINVPDYDNYSFPLIVNELIKQKTNYIIYCNWPRDYIDNILAMENKQYYVNVLDTFISDNYSPVLRINELILYQKR